MFRTVKWILFIFSPLIAIYTLVIFLRNKFYDWKWLKSCSVPATVISVGNVQIGGTGKTPMVELLAKYLSKRKQPVVILSRGYRRSSNEALLVDSENRENVSPDIIGDEPSQLLQNLPGVNLAIDSNRCLSAKNALKKWPDCLFLLDDGFQHRRIASDLNIVMIDPSRWSKVPLLFPISDFRDVKSSLKRAHVLVLNQVGKNQKSHHTIQQELNKILDIPVFYSSMIPREVCPLKAEKQLSLSELEGLKVAIFCGIANPERFAKMVHNFGGEICAQQVFRDHHRYKLSHIQEIEIKAKENGADLLLTTQKDAVKIVTFLEQINIPLYYLKVGMEIQPQQKFFNLIDWVLSGKDHKI
jgi:tetraacyldisaccharide 4'-kinase